MRESGKWEQSADWSRHTLLIILILLLLPPPPPPAPITSMSCSCSPEIWQHLSALRLPIHPSAYLQAFFLPGTLPLFVSEFYCRTSLLHAQPTATFEPLSTLGGHRLYAVCTLRSGQRQEDNIKVGRDCPHPSRQALGSTQPSVQWGPGLSRGVKRPGRGADDPPPSECRGQERVELYLYSPSGPPWPVTGAPLPHLYLII